MNTRSKGTLRSLMVVLVIGAFWTQVYAQDSRRDEILQHFKKGVEYYERGRYGQAAAELDIVLRMQPDLTVALQMRKEAGLAKLIEMHRNKQIAEPIGKIIDLTTQAERSQLRDPAVIEKLIPDYESAEFDKYAIASYKLSYHGQYAVPYLLKYLTMPQPTAAPRTRDQAELEKQVHRDLATRTLLCLERMRRNATLPLLQALKYRDQYLVKQDVFRSRIIVTLGHVGDARAVPALKELTNDPIASIRNYAAESLKKITGKEAKDLAPAHELYYDLALAYFHGDNKVVDYIYEPVYDIWVWDPKGATLKDMLTYVPVPAYLAYLKLAERNCIEGLRLKPDDVKLRTLLVNVYCRQLVLVERFADKSAVPEFGNVEVSQTTADDARKRLPDTKWRTEALIGASGATVLASALQMAIDERDAPTCLILIDAMAGTLLPAEGAPPAVVAAPVASAAAPAAAPAPRRRYETISRPCCAVVRVPIGGAPAPTPAAAETKEAPKPAAPPAPADSCASCSAVRRALDFGDAVVRYEAALTLIKAGPGGEFGETDKTMKIVSTMLAATSTKTALLILDDLQVRNKLSSELRKLNVNTVESTADIGRISNTLLLQPAVDIVFLTANLPPSMFDPILTDLKRDGRTKNLPIVLILDKDAAKDGQVVDTTRQEGVARVLTSDVLVGKYLEKTIVSTYLSEKPKSEVAKANEKYIVKACEVIVKVDPINTKYELAKYLESPLIKAVRGHSDEVKLLAIEALARFGTEDSLLPLRTVISSDDAGPVRGAALKAFGRICCRAHHKMTEAELKAVRECLNDKGADVRMAAGEALGLMGIDGAQYLGVVEEYRPALK